MDSSLLPSDNALAALRKAVRLSLKILPLRQHFGDILLGLGRAGESDQAIRQVLTQWPEQPGLLAVPGSPTGGGRGGLFCRASSYSVGLPTL